MATVTLTQKFKVPVHTLWNAITNADEMKHWYFHIEDFNLAPGSVYTFYEKQDGGTYLHRCKVLEVKPMELFEHTWEHPSHSKGSSVLKWELLPIDDNNSSLTITHSSLENFSDAGEAFTPENYEFGWKGIISIMLRNYLNGIEKLVFETDINAPKEKVWKIMWGEKTYGEWLSTFMEGSYIKGTLGEDERVHLLAPSGEGMYSDIIFFKENEYLVFNHIGYVKDGEELPIDAETEVWTGSLEGFYLTQTAEGTHLKIELDNQKEYHDMMKMNYSVALQKLKSMCET